jgi:hypothetical protein
MKSIAGFVLGIVGAVLWIILMILLIVNWFIFNAIFLTIRNDLSYSYNTSTNSINIFPYFPILSIILIWFIFIGILTVSASIKMNKDKSVRLGGLMAIFLGILSLNPFIIIGGIIGLIDSKK